MSEALFYLFMGVGILGVISAGCAWLFLRADRTGFSDMDDPWRDQ